MANYNVATLTITDKDKDSYSFELLSYNLSDPVTATSKHGQMVKEGLNDPWTLTGEAQYNKQLHRFLVDLAEKDSFFSLTVKVKTAFNSVEKKVFNRCVVQSDVYINSAEKGALRTLNIEFSLDDLNATDVLDI